MGDQAGNVLVQERSTQESQNLTPGVVIQAPLGYSWTAGEG